MGGSYNNFATVLTCPELLRIALEGFDPKVLCHTVVRNATGTQEAAFQAELYAAPRVFIPNG